MRHAAIAFFAASLGGCIALFDFGDYRQAAIAIDGGLQNPLAPSLEVLPSTILRRGTTKSIPITVDRHETGGELVVTLENAPEGLTAPPLRIADGAVSGNLVVSSTGQVPLGPFQSTLALTYPGGNGPPGVLPIDVRATEVDTSFADGGVRTAMNDGTLMGLAVDGRDRVLLLTRLPTRTGSTLLLERDDGHGNFEELAAPSFAVVGEARLVIDGGGHPSIVFQVENNEVRLFTIEEDGRQRLDKVVPIGTPVLDDLVATDTDLFVVHSNENDVRVAALRIADGELDTSYGEAGIVGLDGLPHQRPRAMIDEGRLLLCALHFEANRETLPIDVFRFTNDGSNDARFGDGGRLSLAAAKKAVDCIGIARTGPRNIVGVDDVSSFLAAIDPAGSLAPSFGDGGILELSDDDVVVRSIAVIASDPSHDRLYSLATGAQRQFVVADTIGTARRDPTFGAATAGVLPLELGGGIGAALQQVDSMGRLVCGGILRRNGDQATLSFVARYLP